MTGMDYYAVWENGYETRNRSISLLVDDSPPDFHVTVPLQSANISDDQMIRVVLNNTGGAERNSTASFFYRGQNQTEEELIARKDFINDNVEVQWDTTGLPNDTYYLRLVATDALDQVSEKILTLYKP